jgi:Flp pilus assembly protein TadD
LAIKPHNVDVLNDKGVALDKLGNYSGAIGYYDKALAIKPHDEDTLTNKGNAG